MRTAPLKTRFRNGELVISIGVETLCHAISTGRRYGTGEVVVTDADKFCCEILTELNAEDEDGSTAVHRMLDDATTQAIENGAFGAEYGDA